MHRTFTPGLTLCVLLAVSCTLPMSGQTVTGAEPAKLRLEQPQPHQVVQRVGVAPGAGYAEIVVRGELPSGAERATWEYRVVPLVEQSGRSGDWAPLDVQAEGAKFAAKAWAAAGGWYRLELRCRRGR